MLKIQRLREKLDESKQTLVRQKNELIGLPARIKNLEKTLANAKEREECLPDVIKQTEANVEYYEKKIKSEMEKIVIQKKIDKAEQNVRKYERRLRDA